MATNRTTRILSASGLSDGRVVYLAADRAWTTRFDDAVRYDDPAACDAALAAAKTDELHVCNVHVVEIDVRPDGSLALSARERFRREGPGRVLESLGYARRAQR